MSEREAGNRGERGQQLLHHGDLLWGQCTLAPHGEAAGTARRQDRTIAGTGDIEEQTRQACENLKNAIEAAGGTMDDACRVEVFLRNIGDTERVNKVRREFFGSPPPASTVVEVNKLASPVCR